MARARFYHDPHGRYVVGALDVDMPGSPGRMTVAAIGEDKADALHKAAAIAERITNDPIISALMPPQAKAAILAAKGLGIAAKRGSHVLRGLLHHLRGPGAVRLAKVLHEDVATQEGHQDVSGLWSTATKIAKYGHPAGWAYMAAKYGAKKLRKKKRRAPQREQPAPEPADDAEPDGEGGDGGGEDEAELESED